MELTVVTIMGLRLVNLETTQQNVSVVQQIEFSALLLKISLLYLLILQAWNSSIKIRTALCRTRAILLVVCSHISMSVTQATNSVPLFVISGHRFLQEYFPTFVHKVKEKSGRKWRSSAAQWSPSWNNSNIIYLF